MENPPELGNACQRLINSNLSFKEITVRIFQLLSSFKFYLLIFSFRTSLFLCV